MDGEKKRKINLEDLPKKDVFSAPDGYFENLETRIDARIHSRREARILGFDAGTAKYISLAIAASVLLLIIFLPSRQADPASPSAAQLIAQISDEECLAFLKYSEVEVEDLLGLSEPELWNEAMDDASTTPIELTEEGEELLYEQFGVSPDDSLQIL